MDSYQYQYADPHQICNLTDEQFNKLLKDKIYAINLKFTQSQQCMERLIDNILNLQIGKQTLKLINELVKYFQTPILYCLKKFYSKHKKYFKSLSKSQNQKKSQNQEKSQTPVSKELKILQQIASMYLKLTEGQQEIEQLSFFTQYGVSNKDVTIIKKYQQYQKKYFRWLKKSLVTLKVLKQQQPGQKARLNWVQKTQEQFQGVVKSKQSAWLQRFTLDDVIGLSQEILNFHKSISKTSSKENNESHPRQNQNLDDSQNFPQMNESSNVIIASKKDIKKQKQDLSKISPCFRKFFYQEENISYAQDVDLEYKNFKAPYDKYCVKHIKRAICGFLNRGGGVIFVGIKEDLNDKSRIVKGQRLSEYKKEEVLKEFKFICQQIQPDIISQAKYHIKFVPIKNSKDKYIQGKYIVRVEVSKGDNKSLYTVNQEGNDFVMIRTANEVLRRPINQKTLYNFKQKLLNPTNHRPLGSCPEPQIGIPLLEDKHETRYNEKHEYCPDQDQYDDCYRNPDYQNRKKWRLKTDPISPATKEVKPKDFVYFNPAKNQAKQKIEESKVGKQNKKRNFICDEQDEQENAYQKQSNGNQKQSNGNQKKSNGNQKQSNGNQKQSNGNQKQSKVNNQQNLNKQKAQKNSNVEDKNDMKDDNQNQQDDLDFKPINPIQPKRQRQYKQSKQFYQPFERKPNNYILKPDPQKFQNYEVNRASLVSYTEKPSTIDLLVIGLPFTTVNQIALKIELPLIEPPILCNYDFVTWLSINSKDKQTTAKIKKLIIQIDQKWKTIPQGKKKKNIKVRKLFSNLQFQDQILLNKFIHKFSHDQQFCDQNGVYYYACKDKQQAIQAYMIGYDLDIRIKFISSEDLKAKKLQHLKSKVQKRQNQKNKNIPC